MKKLSKIIIREAIKNANEKLGKMSSEEIAEAVKSCPFHLTKEDINSAFAKAMKIYCKKHPEYKREEDRTIYDNIKLYLQHTFFSFFIPPNRS